MNMPLRTVFWLTLCSMILPGSVPGQTVTNAGGKIQFAESIFDFGKIRAGETVKHSFIFTNIGTEVLNVTHVQPACGCTTAGDWSRTVEPGKTGSIPIQFNSGNFSGMIAKTITVDTSDKSQSRIILQIKGNIWRPIDVSPTFAVIQVPPDSDGGSAVVTIVNNTDEKMTFEEPQSSSKNFTASVSASTNNPKEFKMTISTVPPLPSGNAQGKITVKTSSTNAPVVEVTAWANVQPAFVVLPGQMTLPAPPLANPISPSVLIQNNSTNALSITEPAVNAEDVKIDIRETQPGRQFSVALTFPSGFEVKPGQQLAFTAKSSSPSIPNIRVPISQMPRPVTLPPAAPSRPPIAPAAPLPGAPGHAQVLPPHQLPAVPQQ
jgi:hypothetical protein